MKVVVDTNIIFSAILNSQSWIGQILFCSDKSVKFYSPRFLQIEIQNHFQKIQNHTKLPDSEIHELLDSLYTKIHFISDELIPKEALLNADELTRDIDFNDVMFVALTIHLNCKLWTGDKALMSGLKQKGFKKFISTKELIDKMRK